MSLSRYAGPTTPPLLEQTIGEVLAEVVARFGEREALVSVAQGERYTYRELSEAVDAVARGLVAVGTAKGDRVGIWAPNCSEWLLVQYATARIGAILVTINPAYRSHELAYVLEQSGTSLLVSAQSFKGSDYRAMVAEVAPDLCTVFLGSPDWAALLEAGQAGDALPDRGLSASDPINLQ